MLSHIDGMKSVDHCNLCIFDPPFDIFWCIFELRQFPPDFLFGSQTLDKMETSLGWQKQDLCFVTEIQYEQFDIQCRLLSFSCEIPNRQLYMDHLKSNFPSWIK